MALCSLQLLAGGCVPEPSHGRARESFSSRCSRQLPPVQQFRSSTDSIEGRACPMAEHLPTSYYIYFYVFTCEHCHYPYLDMRLVPRIPQDQMDSEPAVWTCKKCYSPQSTAGHRRAAYAKRLLMSNGKCSERVLAALAPSKIFAIDRASRSDSK